MRRNHLNSPIFVDAKNIGSLKYFVVSSIVCTKVYVVLGGGLFLKGFCVAKASYGFTWRPFKVKKKNTFRMASLLIYLFIYITICLFLMLLLVAFLS